MCGTLWNLFSVVVCMPYGSCESTNDDDRYYYVYIYTCVYMLLCILSVCVEGYYTGDDEHE